MAKELAGDAELWLPAELLEDDFFLEEKRLRVCGFGSHESSFASGLGSASDSPTDSAAETESDEEDYLAGLTRRMTHSFLDDDEEENTELSTLAAQNPKVMSGSPQSTLCGVGLMSALGSEVPNGASQISPPTSPLEKSNAEPWELLYKTSMENQKLLQKQRTFYGLGVLESATKPSPAPTLAPPKSVFPNPLLAHRQLQAAHFYQLRQQQLLKQQQQQQYAASVAAWGRSHNSRVRACGGGYGDERCGPPLGLSPSAWPPLQEPPALPPPAAPAPPPPPQGSGMRAIFLAGAGAKRECAGTGVFLPRRPGAPAEPRKKPSCSTVLLPIRVIQALNLNPDELGAQPRYPGGFVLDHDALIGRSNSMLPHQKRSNNNYLRPQPPSTVTTHELHLPQEWTY